MLTCKIMLQFLGQIFTVIKYFMNLNNLHTRDIYAK